MAYNEKIYGQLLSDAVPGIIRTEEEYRRIESIFNGLISKGENGLSPEENRLFELLANLLEEYEQRTLPKLENSSPAETLRFLMQENDLRQSDLGDVFGSQAVVSKVLSGSRTISKAQAKRLAERFRMSTDAFI
ncbi:MAG: helix-turn-helix domain-containing protein [Pyrinomonadaceae bacterium]